MEPNNRLKLERELRGWSQARVAEAVETTSRTVNRWERGLNSPVSHFRDRLCDIFQKTPEELGLEPPEKVSTDDQQTLFSKEKEMNKVVELTRVEREILESLEQEESKIWQQQRAQLYARI